MEALAEGLWEVADFHEQNGEIGKAVKCLETICQSQVSFLPIVEIKSRLRIATLLLKYTHNVNHAKSHLERSQLLLKSIPSCFELKCRAYSLLSQCYHLIGAIPPQKQIINKGLELACASGDGFAVKLWCCNFTSQLANALAIEGDYWGSIAALERGFSCAAEMYYPELQMFFATSIFHVHLMQWEDVNSVGNAAVKCNEIWEFLQPDKRRQCMGLFFYNELLNTFYQLRICDYKTAVLHVDKLDEAMRKEMQQVQQIKNLTAELNTINDSLSQSDPHNRERLGLYEKQTQLQEQLRQATFSAGMESMGSLYLGNARQMWDKLELAPPPIDGEWLPRSAVYALVDLMVVISGRPKGLFKECGKRIQSGLQLIKEELLKLGITDGVREVNLQHSAIWMAGVYLMLLMQFLENKVAVDLTRSEFVEAQEALLQMKNWFIRFPTILQECESSIEMLRGQYAHSLGCFSEAAFHFLEAAKLTESKSMQAMCHIYAAVSHICIGDAESSSQALDLIGPVHAIMDSFVGVREKTSVLFAYGLLLMKQHNLQEARIRLASGLRITHQLLGNIQLVSQYLTLLGSLALALHDTTQAREILKSSLTLAKTLYDIPTQIWVVSVLTALHQELGEKGNEIENTEFARKRGNDLQKRLSDVRSSIHHMELIEKVKIEVHQLHDTEIRRANAGPSLGVNLDIPESIGLPVANSTPISRLINIDTGRLGFPVVSRSSHGVGFREGIFDHDNGHSWPEAHCSIRNISCMPDQRIPFNQPEITDDVSRLADAALETCSLVKDELGDANMVLPDTHFHTLRTSSATPVQECPSNKDGQTRYLISNNLAVGGAAADIFQFSQDHNFQLLHPHFQNKLGATMLDNDNDIPLVEKVTLENESHKNGEARELKKLDSFGR